MAAAGTSSGPRTRLRAREMDRSEITLTATADNADGPSQSDLRCHRKSPRITATEAENASGPRQSGNEPPVTSSFTTPPPAEPVTDSQQTEPNPVSPPSSPPITTETPQPKLAAPQTIDPTVPLQPTEPPQVPLRKPRKINSREKPRGCDSTGRRRSARLNPIEISSLTFTTVPGAHEPVLPPESSSATQASLSPRGPQASESPRAAQPSLSQSTPQASEFARAAQATLSQTTPQASLSPRGPQASTSGSSRSGTTKGMIAKKNAWIAQKNALHNPQAVRLRLLAAAAKRKTTELGPVWEEPHIVAPESCPHTESAAAQGPRDPDSDLRGLQPTTSPGQTDALQGTVQSPPSQGQTGADNVAMQSPQSQGRTEAVASVAMSPDQPNNGGSPPSQGPTGPDVEQHMQTDGEEAGHVNSDQSSNPQGVFSDDGSRRCCLRRPLRSVPEAWGLSGIPVDIPAAGGVVAKRKRGTKGKETRVKRGRGLAKPRDPKGPSDRPRLTVVGDAEFKADPDCTKMVPTIRILTLANLPGPFRSYNVFPSSARLEILRQFLHRYSWAEKEDVGRCIDVFENIAAEAYSRHLVDVRRDFKEKFGPNKEDWKGHCPRWCEKDEIWQGLCDIWSNPVWEHQSSTNRANKLRGGRVSHVGGSRSTFRHKQAMMQASGGPVGLKELFDRTHMKNTEAGPVYVNTRSLDVMLEYEELRKTHDKEVDDQTLWEQAVNGEDRKGRLFGFGNKSRMKKTNRELEAVEAVDASASDPTKSTKSTATSAEDENIRFSKEEVAELIAKEVAAARAGFADEMAAQSLRHKAELEKVTMDTSQTRACFDTLFKHTGAKPPIPGWGSSQPSDEAQGAGGGEENQP